MIRYTKEQRDFLLNNNYMKTAKELADIFNKKFEANITPANIKSFRGNNHLNSGLTGRFEKGHKTHNKGKKWDEYMPKESQKKCRKVAFKKGRTPHNHKKVGSEWRSKDGYIEIKISEHNRWKLKHRYIYEKKYGCIPKGYDVIFLDGNKNNLNIDNLKLVSKKENLIMNKNRLFTTDKDLTFTGVVIAKVISKTRELLKNQEKE